MITPELELRPIAGKRVDKERDELVRYATSEKISYECDLLDGHKKMRKNPKSNSIKERNSDHPFKSKIAILSSLISVR